MLGGVYVWWMVVAGCLMCVLGGWQRWVGG